MADKLGRWRSEAELVSLASTLASVGVKQKGVNSFSSWCKKVQHLQIYSLEVLMEKICGSDGLLSRSGRNQQKVTAELLTGSDVSEGLSFKVKPWNRTGTIWTVYCFCIAAEMQDTTTPDFRYNLSQKSCLFPRTRPAAPPFSKCQSEQTFLYDYCLWLLVHLCLVCSS